ncbi:MAG: YciI family protein [Alphaproteobacteria bacterium]|nr:YciI family protein [Alphaproteobacteria bacterium]
MRVMVISKTVDCIDASQPPTPEALEAFAAMDRFTEELVKAGVFVAAAGLKNDGTCKRVVFDDGGRTIIDGPFAEAKEMIAGFSIWQVKDMDEAMAWVARAPVIPGARGAMELRPFFEAADLEGYVSPEDLATPREGERGKLGVA